MRKSILTFAITLISLLSISTNTFASPSEVNNCNLKKFQVVQNLYLYINSSKFSNPQIKDFKAFFNPKIKMTTNNIVVATGYNQFKEHFIMLNKNIKGIYASNFNYLYQNTHKLVLKYQINGKDQSNSEFNTREIVSFDFDNKCQIDNWDQVAITNKPFDINKLKVKN
ncbi:hypothetical protein [Francisella sp. 19X1-34]|uniref:hypothetical protein n=1 Tax=Francisella sp. 19X1-34 TaxID=3087177 RepID=UPI002E35A341|nr:hypothetical protein [Francisella sp. 19X1-34]MED7789556.1 hypothetical protein [Francisella sp. 19X1-34]